ncbi:transposase [Simiduia agarivorans]|uniref:transposase n=1 Tax=Simiduia agarivorans TaxID=447471 RepID=UPI0004629F8D|nr:transposase [Simiduia agarivorans]
MARLPRLFAENVAQHVIQRGNNRQHCFLRPDDYQFYLQLLQTNTQRFEVELHAYVLMTNHVHLMLTPAEKDSCPRMMQAIGRSYVQYFNDHQNRTGTLWEGRYKSTLVDTEAYGLALYRYIENNPVRAGMVSAPGLYGWSSYRANATGAMLHWLTPHASYLALGDTLAKRMANYRALFRTDQSETTLEKIREATQKGWIMGDSEFAEQLVGKVNRRVQPLGPTSGVRLP